MRILVTGHNGYIGSVMVPMLKSDGHEVVGMDTYFFEDCTLGPGGDGIIHSIRKDVRDVNLPDLLGFDAVIHLAALSNDPLGNLEPDWTFDINHKASVKLAKLAKEAGVKHFLYASSCSLYGAAGEDILTEEAPFHPLTPYAVSKVRTEEDVCKLADTHFSPTFMRNATVYGVSPRLRADVVLNNLVCWAHTTGKVRILSDGTPWRPIVHVEDVARAFASVIKAPREVIHNQAFNIGVNDENYQVRDLAEIVTKTIPGCKVEFSGHGGADPRSYRVDFSKLAQELPEFQPAWNARRGAQELYAALQQVGLTLDDFQGRKFIRLRQLKYLLTKDLLDGTLRWKK